MNKYLTASIAFWILTWTLIYITKYYLTGFWANFSILHACIGFIMTVLSFFCWVEDVYPKQVPPGT